MAIAAILNHDRQLVDGVALGAGVIGSNVLVLAGVLPTLELVGALDFRAEQRGAGGEVVDIDKAQVFVDLVIRLVADARIDADRGLAPLVAVEAHVGREVALAEGDRGSAGEAHGIHFVDRELLQVVVARAAVQAVAGRLAGDHALGYELGLAGGGVALGASAGHNAAALLLRVPVAERLLGTGEVAVVDAVGGADIHRRVHGPVQVRDRVVEQLDDVLAAVGVNAGVLLGHLEVVGRLGQASRPVTEGVVEDRLRLAQRAVAVGVGEEVRVGRGVVADHDLARLHRVRLHRLPEQVAQPLDLVVDALFHVAVAVVVDQRTEHANVGHVLHRLDTFVARLALLQVDLERMRVVTLDAGVVAGHMVEAGVIGIAAILIPALGQRPILGRRRGVVVDVGEAHILADRVQVFRQAGVGDALIHRDGGRAPLVALHTTRLIAQIEHLDPGREDDARTGDDGVVVAGRALHGRADGRGRVNHVDRAAIGANEVLEAGRAVALGAVRRHFGRVFLVPVVERLAFRVIVGRVHPLVEKGHGRAGGDRLGLAFGHWRFRRWLLGLRGRLRLCGRSLGL